MTKSVTASDQSRNLLQAVHHASESAIAAAQAEDEVARKQSAGHGLSRPEAEAFLLSRWAAGAALFLKALGDRTRLRLIGMLAEREPLEVGELAKALGVRSPTASQHVALLRDARIIHVERRGIHTECYLNRGFLAWRLDDIAARIKVR